MKTPGPHAMTAQAGAVAAWLFRRANSDDEWSPIMNEKHRVATAASPDWEVRPVYFSTPVAVPVEALEELVREWHGCRDGSACGLSWAEVNDMFADELTQLIKERSNG